MSRDPERKSRDPNMLKAQYLENSWRCYLVTIANYYTVCCEAVRSATLATAWFLVIICDFLSWLSQANTEP